jgi:hypothetical protein
MVKRDHNAPVRWRPIRGMRAACPRRLACWAPDRAPAHSIALAGTSAPACRAPEGWTQLEFALAKEVENAFQAGRQNTQPRAVFSQREQANVVYSFDLRRMEQVRARAGPVRVRLLPVRQTLASRRCR